MSTGGSRGIRASQDYVRQGGATARTLLLQAAAAEWKVPVEELTVDKGAIRHAKSSRTTTYGKVATAAAKLPVPDLKTMKLKDAKDWKIAGKPLKRLDTADKLDGRKIYGIDLKLSGMLNASIRDTPIHGGKIKGFDGESAKKMPPPHHLSRRPPIADQCSCIAILAAKKAMTAQTGNVTIQASTMRFRTPHRTSAMRFDAPAPTMQDVIVCVVDSGMPNIEATKMVDDAEASAANPCHETMRVIFEPTVSMIFQPPKLVPSPMVNAQTMIAEFVISNFCVAPPSSIVSANTPMNFCPSFSP